MTQAQVTITAFAPSAEWGRCPNCNQSVTGQYKGKLGCKRCGWSAIRGFAAHAPIPALQIHGTETGRFTTSQPNMTEVDRVETPAPEPIAPQGYALVPTDTEMGQLIATAHAQGRWMCDAVEHDNEHAPCPNPTCFKHDPPGDGAKAAVARGLAVLHEGPLQP